MITLNLLPDDFLKQRMQRRANYLCLILFCIVMAGVLAAAVASERNSRRTQEVADRVNAAYADAARLIAEMQQLQGQKQTMLSKAETTASLMERVPRSYLLSILTNAMPEHVSLKEFNLDIRRVVTQAKPKAATAGNAKFEAAQQQRNGNVTSAPLVVIDVTGYAGTDVEVARFIATLAKNPVTQSVDLVYSEQKLVGTTPVREFQIRMELRADGDAMEAIRNAPAVEKAEPEPAENPSEAMGT
jgi:hypothetical protein